MKILYSLLLFLLTATFVSAQSDWPKVITADDGSIVKIFQPQPESFTNNVLKYRSAFSYQSNANDEPTFGTFWSIAKVETDRDNRKLLITSIKIPNLKLAGDSAMTRSEEIKSLLENQIPIAANEMELDPILTSLDMRTEEKKLSKDLNNNPPKIIYATQPSILVVIDGEPKFQHNNDWNLDAVVNTPFTIVRANDTYFLFGGKHWYQASSATGPYQYIADVPSNVKRVEQSLDKINTNDPAYETTTSAKQDNVISDIIVSTVPAELVQSKGQPSFTNIDGTNLSYVSNSDNDIFIDNNSKEYYVLLSGRWYHSSQLNNGNWQYLASNSLPADFAKIPEGSPKDNVLASVAGTDAAREAVIDAQIPQTAKVDRNTATANVTYDGKPQFQNIQGTNMQYGVNTQSSVIYSNGRYYCVDKGVWFDAPTPTGPWTVSTQRPDEVDMIPPSSPVYNVKYVYIYDVTPDWVYMGYTPGYLNAFIYGPTVVYGTGFYYRPWWGNYYYARPYTWGFGMRYNPWIGWTFGYDYSWGWFNVGFGMDIWGGWLGGWWGPHIYRPPYRWRSWGGGYGYGGYYGRNMYNNRVVHGGGIGGGNHMNARIINNNIYNYRKDVIVNNARINNPRDVSNSRGFNNGSNRVINNGGGFNNGNNRVNGNPNMNRAGSNPSFNQRGGVSTMPSNAAPSNGRVIATDRAGNVYQRTPQGQWQQQSQSRQWQNVNPTQRPQVVQNLNNYQKMENRGQTRVENFQSQRSFAPSFSRPSSSNNNSRPSGGGGRVNNGGGGNSRHH